MKSKFKFSYSYVIIALCFISVCISLGFCSSGRTMYLKAICEALSIDKGLFSLNDTFRFITTTVLNIFFGTLVNKFGTKKLMCAGFISLIAFAIVNSFAKTLFVFYIGGVLLGIGLAWTSTTMMSAVINVWCHDSKYKGAITGAVLAANGLGGAISAQVLTPFIFSGTFGYRTSYRLVAVILAVTLVLIIIFFRETPKGTARPVIQGKKAKKARGGGWIGMEYTEVKKKPYFYLALLCMALTGMSLQGLGGISTPHMYDIGLDEGYVAMILTASSLGLMGSKFLVGFMYDKIGMRLTMNISLACSFLSLIGLVLIDNSSVGRVIAMVRVVFYAIAMPLETVMLPLFASELFGNKCFIKTVGLFTAASTAGFALGSPFANLCFDIFGDYNFAFIVFACLMLFVTVTMQLVLTKAHRDRKIILEREVSSPEPIAEGV